MSRHANLRRRFSSSSSWSDLPPELLLSIVDRLNPNSDDLRSLHCVCKRWRSAIAPPSLTLSPLLPREITALSHDGGGPQLPKYLKLPFAVVPTSVRLFRRLHHQSWLVAVEQPNPGKVRLFHPLTGVPISEYDHELKLPKFVSVMASTELSKGFSLRFPSNGNRKGQVGRCQSSFSNRKYINKVLLWPSPHRRTKTFESSSLMVLGTAGDLVCLPLDGSIGAKKISSGAVTKFDDIVLWKDMVVAVDRLGRLYRVEYQTREITMLLVAISRFKGQAVYERRKRLFVDSHTGKLYLVVRWVSCATDKGTKFEVFSLNSFLGMWEKVRTLGDRVLFVSFDTCFFVPAAEIPGFENNCIVYPKDCFPAYKGTTNFPDGPLFLPLAESSPYLEIWVYQHGLESYNFKLISSCPGFPEVLWPPPQWIWDDTPSSYEESAEQAEETSSEQSLTEVRGIAYALGLDSTEDSQGEMHNDAIHTTPNTILPQTFEGNNGSRVVFEGVRVRTDLVPILEKIWAKHGNIIGRSAVQNGDIVARALESLVMVIRILEVSSRRSLENWEADYVSSALRDLQFMCFSVDWLVPFVETALAADSLRDIKKNRIQSLDKN